MNTAEWTLEVALDAAVACIERHLPGYLAARLAEDALRARPLLNGHLPMPKVVTTGMIDDLAADWVTPAIFINAVSTSYQNYNASSLLDSQPRITATILIAEGDVNTSEQRIYSNALSMYSDGVRYILSTIFPQDGGCEVGVNAATPDSVQYSPVVRPDGYSVWLRWSEVSVVWTQRVNNYWQTEPPTPPPFDPLSLNLPIVLDPTDLSTMFIDSAGTIPVTSIGDPVGRWKNKGTAGSAGDFVQTVSAQRPIYGGGFVLFDGGGSRMASGYTPTLPSSVFANVERFGPPPTGGAHRIFATPTTLPYIEIGDISRGINSRFVQSGLGQIVPNIGGRAIKTIGAEWSTARFRAYIGASFVDGGAMPLTNFTTAGPWNINLNGSVQQRVGHVFISDRTLTDDERGDLIAWMEQRA